MLTIPAAVKLCYAPDPVAMWLDFDGLFALVRNRLQADPLSGHLFIFRNKHADRLKVLYGGGHGLCLWCQRLEVGRY
jgi:transposase